MIAWHETSWHTILLSTKASIWSNSNCYDPKQQKAISKFQTSNQFSRVLNLHPGLYDPESRQQCVVPKLSPHPIYTNITPPTPHWRHRLLYLSLNLPVPATNNAAPSNVFATNADCTSDWLYLLFATSADCTSDYLLQATAPLVLHQPPRTNLFVTAGSSTGHRAAMQLNHARPCNYILNSTYLVFSVSK